MVTTTSCFVFATQSYTNPIEWCQNIPHLTLGFRGRLLGVPQGYFL